MMHGVFLVVFVVPAVTDLNPPDIQATIQKGLTYAYVENIDSARLYFDSVIVLYPDNPAGYFFKAALLQLKMMDECHRKDEKEYLSLIRTAITKAENITQVENNQWAEFYLGSSYTYRAVYDGYNKNYFEAFTYGVKGGKILQAIIKDDTTFYDAYLGAGTYEYFWARAARYLPILKLAGGDVHEAIRKLRVAAQRSLYSGTTARNSLVFIYGEESEFTKADTIATELLLEYPSGKTFLWSKADLEFKRKDYYAAATMYNELFKRYDGVNKNYSNMAQCKLLIGKCFFELHEKDKAREALKQVISYKPYADEYPQIKQYCREAYALLSRIL